MYRVTTFTSMYDPGVRRFFDTRGEADKFVEDHTSPGQGMTLELWLYVFGWVEVSYAQLDS